MNLVKDGETNFIQDIVIGVDLLPIYSENFSPMF